jgi:hypothetical protein
MNRESAERTEGIVRANASRVVAITTLIIALLIGRPVHADNVDTLIGQLEDDSDRVRISAVLALTKQSDPRAIEALAGRLLGDSVKNIRSLAAKALGTIVTDRVKGRPRQVAIDALSKAAQGDKEEIVKVNAQRSLDQIGASAPVKSVSGGGGGGGVYVNIGPMSSKTGSDDAKYRSLMQKTAGLTMNKVASSMATTWPGGSAPSKADLAKKGVQGFFVDGTLTELKVDKSGSSAKVSCKVSMLLASYPDKSMFGFLNGGAAVQASSSPSELALAGQDCVAAVIESLITKQIVPTIKSKVGP